MIVLVWSFEQNISILVYHFKKNYSQNKYNFKKKIKGILFKLVSIPWMRFSNVSLHNHHLNNKNKNKNNMHGVDLECLLQYYNTITVDLK